MTGDEDLARRRRDENLRALWEPLHERGFVLVDPQGERVSPRAAVERRGALRLRRMRRAMQPPQRIGFFTHSLIGNALFLLTGDAAAAPSVSGADLSLDVVSAQPNRHYLRNATPVDLGRVVLIRHGLTEANRHGIALGRSNGSEGWRGEVVERFERSAPRDVAAWHCSTLVRTQQTARMFGVREAEPHAALDEMDIGAAEGIPESTVIASFASAHWMYRDGDPFAAIVDELRDGPPRAPGECFVDVLLRVAECLEREIGAE